MNGQDLINSRRSIYKFTEETVGDDILNQALIAASNAPCHKHTHPWRFYILGREIRSKLIPTITKLSKIKSEKMQSKNIEADAQRATRKITDPPLLIAVTSQITPNDDFRTKEDYAATVCALHNLVLSLWDNGIGSQWSTGSITRDNDTYELLSIDSKQEEIIGFIKAGYPEKIRAINKKPVDEFVNYVD